jgi:hypothetical protein
MEALSVSALISNFEKVTETVRLNVSMERLDQISWKRLVG